MIEKERAQTHPTLPQRCTDAEREAREFETALARTQYNYTRSYLPPLPFSADVPDGEEFSAYYIALVVTPILEVFENLKNMVVERIAAELASDMRVPDMSGWVAELQAHLDDLEDALGKLSKDGTWSALTGDLIEHFQKAMKSFEETVATIKRAPVQAALQNVSRLPGDLQRIIDGYEKLVGEAEHANLLTTFLKDTLYDTLRDGGGRFLEATSFEDYANLYTIIPPPGILSIERKPWMGLDEGSAIQPWQQDWYLGYLQIAGFNTTQLRGVLPGEPGAARSASTLAALREKLPLSDEVFARVIGVPGATLAEASAANRLYVVDLEQMHGIPAGVFHGHQRYVTAPIALFYWNDEPHGAFPPGGAMQPVAIQIGQVPDAAKTPVFTPLGVGGDAIGDDPGGRKWRLAKYFLNNALAIQHETVAHLGNAHLIIEPIVVATHRTLPAAHPVYTLLWPHFRFTLEINHSAFNSLVVPGGVVASVLGTSIEGSMKMVREAHLAWRFDDHRPDHEFALRAVDASRLPDFPFRDDTLLLWQAIRDFVQGYLGVYYRGDDDVAGDAEVQDWVRELTAADGAALQGMDGLVAGDGQAPPRVESLDYLTDVVAMIVYTASARHASVNYAQFPLMSYAPSVSGGVYRPPPDRDEAVDEARILATMPPLDVALYQGSFGYLLSSIQFDRLGYYTQNERRPYFVDPRVHGLVARFQGQLAAAETAIRDKNESRAFPYLNQLPSQVPNSISI